MPKCTPLLQLAIIIIVGGLIYAGSLTTPFNFDDEIYIVQNPAIKSFAFFMEPARLAELALEQDVRYNFILRPVAYLTFAINYSLNGLDVRGYHLVNLCLHIANALLVWRFLGLTLITPYMAKHQQTNTAARFAALLPLFAALLFVSHPLQTQGVTYIVQRFVPLSCFFFLSALVLYARSRLSDRRAVGLPLAALALLATLLAMKTKETGFTLPLVLLIYESAFFTGSVKKRLLRLLPFLATMAVIPWTVMGLAAPGQSDPSNLVNFSGVSRWEYLWTQFGVVVGYLRLLVFPVGQSIDHDYPLARHFFSVQVLLPLFVLTLLLGAAVFFWLRSAPHRGGNPWLRLIAFGIFWFFVTLSVESSFIPLDDLFVEHRIYLPSIGFFTSLLAVAALCVTDHAVKTVRVILAAVLVLLCLATVRRNSLWTDNVSIWRDAVAKNPESARTYNNLGYWLSRKGRHEEAVTVLRRGVELSPDYARLYTNLGIALSSLNRLDQALPVTREAFVRDPSNPKIANNLATLYLRMGMIREGRALLLKTVEQNPGYGSAYYNLGCLLEQEGKLDEALEILRRAERLNSHDVELQQMITGMIQRVLLRMAPGDIPP